MLKIPNDYTINSCFPAWFMVLLYWLLRTFLSILHLEVKTMCTIQYIYILCTMYANMHVIKGLQHGQTSFAENVFECVYCPLYWFLTVYTVQDYNIRRRMKRCVVAVGRMILLLVVVRGAVVLVVMGAVVQGETQLLLSQNYTKCT